MEAPKPKLCAPGHVPKPVWIKDGHVFYSTGYWSHIDDVIILKQHKELHHLTNTDISDDISRIQALQGEESRSLDGQVWIRLCPPRKE